MKKLLSLLILSVFTTMAFAQLRLSQVYGGGGNSGATIKNDFIEIFNAGAASITIPAGGYSVQYASATGAFSVSNSTVIPAGSVIPAGAYFLIVESAGAGGTALTGGDVTGGTIALSGTTGKVALVNSTAAAPSCTDASVLDVMGFGPTATCSGGITPMALLTNTTAAIRNLAGCAFSSAGNTAADFTAGTPAPRSSIAGVNSVITPVNVCGGGGTASLTPTPSSFTNVNATPGSPSNEFTYSLSGTNLTAGPIVVTPSANIEISLTTGGPYTTSPLNISYTAPTLTSTPVYARIANTAAAGAFSGTIGNAGGGATTTVSVTGNILVAEPLVQTSNIVFSNVTDHSFQFSWTNGDGASRIAVIRLATGADVAPADGTVYTANSAYGLGSTLTPNNYVVYSGTGSGPVTVTGLAAGTNYSVKIYEYNGSGASANFLTSVSGTNNPVAQITTGTAPVNTILQQNFTGLSVPLYMPAASSTNRVPAMFYATVRNLAPGTAYRYFTAGAVVADLGTTTTAGLPILIDYNNGNGFSIPSTASIGAATASGNFGTFTTDASGSFSGSFGIMPSTNARFNAGNVVYPVICLGIDNGTATTIQQRLALDLTLTALPFGITATDGTFIKGASSATAKNLVALWQSTDGSSFITGLARPLAMTYTENAGAATTVIAGYDNTAGAWNTIIPNNNPNGVELIQQLDLVTGNTAGCNSDADGIWPSGAVTVNPNTGVAPVVITATDASLTGGACFSILAVSLNAFNATKVNNTVRLSWSTAQEINSNHFDVLRSADGISWTAISTVAAAGNSSSLLNYSVVDNNPLKGKNLYKLRFVDNSGKQSFSDIKMILFTDRFSVIVYPNPVRDRINITLGSNGNSPVEITVFNATGAVVGKFITQSTSYSINVAGLSKGMYILKVKADSFSDTEKIIIN